MRLLTAAHATLLLATTRSPPVAVPQHHRCLDQRHHCLGQRIAAWRHSRAAVRLQAAADDRSGEEDDNNGGSLARPVNRYVTQIQNISAPELIKGFAETAPAEVQQAVRSTVVSLLGNLPPHLYDVNVMSTGQNVASLMYSMQMTGYMFRNAEYRKSLLETLAKGESASASGTSGASDDSPSGSGSSSGSVGEHEGEAPTVLPPVSGKIKVKLSDSMETEVEASAYMAELRNEVSALRGELAKTKEEEAAQGGGDLLTYMQGLGRENVAALTSSISQEVLEAMRSLIENILLEAGVGGESFMETSGLKLRELLVWQLITGYKLRELEAKQELERIMANDDPDVE